ncbi:hypothetical protein BU24DRAFT_456579 [Aaosphaeria arxii CBS 175.79]|uniref:DUF7605 domain-containing protein n=1 Tax=Aaosphaeria arxii CBS 175.79 TaxID=1450172 RepID=A0A6A5Y5F8_9PLEO|nr:uncharacterized protein BU24DRAFT_456579 [Aaosphaeria arxii CBS 175.79]KAF2020509.1 hypothetical protein BU24DRAFT_456579 [Aaosphaeria arxii CBS 175.79]
MAQRVLKRADWTIVVHRNERADDDAAVKSYIEDAWRRKRDSVAVVITQIDKVNELKDKRTEFKVDEEEDLQYLSEQEKHINSEMTKIKKQLKTTPRKSEFLITLNEQRDLYAIHEKHIDIKRLEILIARRSRQLEHEFRTFHSALTKGTYAGGAHELPVFCVTSTEYMKHLEPYSPLEPPGVSVQRSGIPALRHFLLNLPHKSGRSLALKRHCDIRVRALLSSMALSCSGFRPMLRRELLRKVVTNAVESMLMCCGRVIKEFCSDNILEVKDRFEIRESIWIEKAEALCDKWAKYNPAGHLAFVRNEGHWKTSACGTANWNNSLIQIMRDDMEPVLNHLCDHGLPHLRSEFLLTFDDILEDMQTQIRQCLRNTVQQQVKSATYLRFFDTLEKQKGSITASMDSLVEPLQRSTRLLISKCMSNNETAPFTANMQSLYLECEQSQATKGKGKRMTKHAVRCETFKMGVCDRRKGPYTEVKTCFLNKFGSVFTKWETRLRTEIYPIIEQIEHDFNQVFPEREESSLSKESQAVIGAAVRKAQAVLDGPIRESLAKAGIPMESTMPNMVQN